MITCDIKSGFHHVPLDSDYQNYITFCWNGLFYKWKVIPFGLCLSPYYFCKIVRSVIQFRVMRTCASPAILASELTKNWSSGM